MRIIDFYKPTIFLTMGDKVAPNFILTECFGISNHQKEVFGSGNGHIKSSQVRQEAQSSCSWVWVIASHTVEDNYVLLTALERVNSVALDGILEPEDRLPTNWAEQVF